MKKSPIIYAFLSGEGVIVNLDEMMFNPYGLITLPFIPEKEFARGRRRYQFSSLLLFDFPNSNDQDAVQSLIKEKRRALITPTKIRIATAALAN
ncbi:MAG: hypothetical protein WC146_02845 [Patescibacteria group bacterium]|jgi:hypothetical protein